VEAGVLEQASGGGADAPPPALRLAGLTKVYPGIVALSDVSLTVAAGTTHGIVGENGAGKSTLAKVVSGAVSPDEGTIEISGQAVTGGDPRGHSQAGVAMIYQDPGTIDTMTAAENVFLGREQRRGPFIDRRKRAARFAELTSEFGIDLDPNASTATLSVAQRRLLDMLKAVDGDHRLLIMDEPTASLGVEEREAVYHAVARLNARGVAVIYISHDLREVLRLAQEVSVMRDGALVETRASAAWTPAELVRAMTGRESLVAVRDLPAPTAEVGLCVESLAVPGVLEDVSFSARRGEIIGIAGLMGSGRTSLLRAIAGAADFAEGWIDVGDGRVPLPRSVRAAGRAGIVIAPEDRKRQGLVLSLPSDVNVVLPRLKRASASGLISRRRLRTRAAGAVGGLNFDVARLGADAGTFSGGNQQKLLIGKCLEQSPRVLLLDEPTTGIDVGAKAEMFDIVVGLAERGMTVVVTSPEFEELVSICHRIFVLAQGRIVGVLEAEQRSVRRILELVFAVEPDADPEKTEEALPPPGAPEQRRSA
jgi:ABC-type sugar transport system ATPase subunit